MKLRILPVLMALAVLASPAAHGQSTPADTVNRVGFDQNLGAQLPLGTRFRDDTGREVTLGELFGRKPVVLVPGYYGCPLLCSQVLNGLTRTFRGMTETAGKDFEVVAYSINPEEKPELAARKKANYLERYGRTEGAAGWHFLTGDEASIEAVSKVLGFRYVYDPVKKVYSHAAGIVVVTPDGHLSRYLYGLDFPVRDLQHELAQAGKGKIGSPLRQLLLLCYDYDAATGRYTLSILRVLRLLGSLTVVSLGSYVGIMFLRDRRRGDVRAGAGERAGADGQPDGPAPGDNDTDLVP